MDEFSKIAGYWMESLFQKLDNDSYFAHICSGVEPETLLEHIQKMIGYACLLVEEHGLDSIIDKLVKDVVKDHSESSQERLKELYLPLPPMAEQSRIVGKINEVLSSIMSR